MFRMGSIAAIGAFALFSTFAYAQLNGEYINAGTIRVCSSLTGEEAGAELKAFEKRIVLEKRSQMTVKKFVDHCRTVSMKIDGGTVYHKICDIFSSYPEVTLWGCR